MQAVADFYAGFALFMLAGSLIALAYVVLQPIFARFWSAPLPAGDRRAPSAAAELPDRPSATVSGPTRKAA